MCRGDSFSAYWTADGSVGHSVANLGVVFVFGRVHVVVITGLDVVGIAERQLRSEYEVTAFRVHLGTRRIWTAEQVQGPMPGVGIYFQWCIKLKNEQQLAVAVFARQFQFAWNKFGVDPDLIVLNESQRNKRCDATYWFSTDFGRKKSALEPLGRFEFLQKSELHLVTIWSIGKCD